MEMPPTEVSGIIGANLQHLADAKGIFAPGFYFASVKNGLKPL